MNLQDPYDPNSSVPVPVYFTPTRERVLTEIRLPCETPEKVQQSILASIGLFVDALRE